MLVEPMYNINDFINSDLPNKDYLLKYLNPKQKLVIFDVGCCEAEDSIRYRKLFPESTLHSFEALDTNYDKATRIINLHKAEKIKLNNLALSDEKGEQDFYISEGSPEGEQNTEFWDFGNKSSSLLKPDKVTQIFDWLKFKSKKKVKTETLLNYVLNHGIVNIDLLHLDVQGAELKVLVGAGDFIENIKLIWLEVENEHLYANQPLKKDIISFLSKKGFYIDFDGAIGLAGDMLFVNKKFFPQKKRNSDKSNLLNKVKYKLFTERNYRKISYSQAGEDLLIQQYFSQLGNLKPSYIDIGAHHPFRLNNTYLFYKFGGRGINIEPDPHLISLFEKFRPEDVNLNIGIDSKDGRKPLYIFHPNTLNTFSEQEYKKNIGLGHTLVRKTEIELKRITTVLNEFKNGVFPDLLSIDVEGMDLSIITELDLSKNYPKVICAETTVYDGSGLSQQKNNALIENLISKGYKVYADTFVNTIFYKE
ncbi:MAG: FkbM family methyltransferase [Bacteroidia bacterium]